MTIDKEIDVNNRRQSVSTGKLMDTTSALKMHINQRLYDVRETIDNHIEQIHSSVMENVKLTIKYIQMMQKSNKKISKRPNGGRNAVLLDPSMFTIRRLWDQVASPEESQERDFGIAIHYQPIAKSEITKLEPIKQTIPMEKKEQMKPTDENKLRLTQGEQEELMAILTKTKLLETIPRMTRSDEKIETSSMPTSHAPLQTTPAILKLVLVDTKIERFKRQNPDDKMVNGPLLTFLL